MIEQITLKNWKSFHDTTLFLNPLTVLIGTNASGKSNALEALLFLSRTARGERIQDSLEGSPSQPSIRGGVEGATLKPADQCTLQVLLNEQNAHIEYFYHVTIEPELYLVVAERLIRTEYPQEDQEDEAAKEIVLINTDVDQGNFVSIHEELQPRGIVGRIDRIMGLSGLFTSLGRLEERLPEHIMAIAQMLQQVVILDPNPATMREQTRISGTLANDGSNIAGVFAHLPQERRAMIEAVLPKYLSRLLGATILRVWAEPVAPLNKDAILCYEEQWTSDSEPRRVESATMSDGMLRVLAIFIALLIQPPSSLLAIENIDYGLHPIEAGILLQMLFELGQQQQVQIVVTTHNPTMLETIDAAIIPSINVVHRDMATGESLITLMCDATHLSRFLSHLLSRR